MQEQKHVVHGPYNFVPLSEHIILPEWGDLVSQDIPFRDGKDGELDITITAMSEIFVRNGKEGREELDSDFSQAPDGRYFIPGTSVKGMIRNVLEIATFSRMRNISDRRYGIRDLDLTAYRDRLTETIRKSKVQAGFLDISSDDWKIIPCRWAKWRRSILDTPFGNSPMTAAKKYKEFLQNHGSLEQSGNVVYKDKDGEDIIPGEFTFDSNGEKKGVLVFTGQPQECNPENPSGKQREYFFYDPQEDKTFPVDPVDPEDENSDDDDESSEKIRPNQRDFKFIHIDQSASKDFEAWLGKIDGAEYKKDGQLFGIRMKYFNGRIPVFYVRDGKVLRFGLAAMFRFAGAVSTGEALRNTNPEHFTSRRSTFAPDMADLIFGYVTREKSLRGRVQFSGCFADTGIKPAHERSMFLANPKPSFFPAYLEQNPKLTKRDEYKTFLDKDARLRGWKRYPALVKQDAIVAEKNNSDFAPLPAGTVFIGKIRYHNLREVELGALLWSLRLKTQQYHCHSLGMAKPYGYGKVKVEISGIDGDEQKRLIGVFKGYVDNELQKQSCPRRFDETPQIEALLEMALYDNARTDWNFTYMSRDECRFCKGRSSKGGKPSSVLVPYEVIRDTQVVRSAPKPEPKKKGANFELIAQIRVRITNGQQVLKLLNKINSPSQDEIAEIEKLLNQKSARTWRDNPYSQELSKKVSAKMKQFKEELQKNN